MKSSRSRTVKLVAGAAGLGALVLVYQARSGSVTPPAPTARTSGPLAAAGEAGAHTRGFEAAPASAASKLRPISGLPPPRFVASSPPTQPTATPLSRPGSTTPLVDKSRSAVEQARGIYDALGIPPEQRTQIKQVLDIQRERFQEIREQLRAGQIDRHAFDQAIGQLRAETDANLTAVLGAEGVKAWRSYQRELGTSLGPSLAKVVEP